MRYNVAYHGQIVEFLPVINLWREIDIYLHAEDEVLYRKADTILIYGII